MPITEKQLVKLAAFAAAEAMAGHRKEVANGHTQIGRGSESTGSDHAGAPAETEKDAAVRDFAAKCLVGIGYQAEDTGLAEVFAAQSPSGLSFHGPVDDDRMSGLYRAVGGVGPAAVKLAQEDLSLRQKLHHAGLKVHRDPSDAQVDAGNYRKGHIHMHGMRITIENPKGSVRSGTDAKGKSWEVTMKHHYGYVRQTVGHDGDHVDCFIGPHPHSELVFVIEQVNPQTGRFDEVKCMLGFTTRDEAQQAYLDNYTSGWKGLREITPMTMDQFKAWVREGTLEGLKKAATADPSQYLMATTQLDARQFRAWLDYGDHGKPMVDQLVCEKVAEFTDGPAAYGVLINRNGFPAVILPKVQQATLVPPIEALPLGSFLKLARQLSATG